MERHFHEERKKNYGADSTSLLQNSRLAPVAPWEHKVPQLQDTDDATDAVLIILDCSNSMKNYPPIGFSRSKSASGSSRLTKLEAAKSVILSIVQRLPTKTILGLRTLGTSLTGDPFYDCKQSKLAVPPDKNNRKKIVDYCREIEPVGSTPLEFALRQAAESDLAKLPGTKKIILLCDGADTCGGNPCEFVKQLPRLGLAITVDVLGFAIRDSNARGQLQCIADSTAGQFFDISSTDELAVFLQNLDKSKDKK